MRATIHSPNSSSAFGATFDLPFFQLFVKSRIKIISWALSNMREGPAFCADRDTAGRACHVRFHFIFWVTKRMRGRECWECCRIACTVVGCSRSLTDFGIHSWWNESRACWYRAVYPIWSSPFFVLCLIELNLCIVEKIGNCRERDNGAAFRWHFGFILASIQEPVFQTSCTEVPGCTSLALI
jgi:hypothetical protein